MEECMSYNGEVSGLNPLNRGKLVAPGERARLMSLRTSMRKIGAAGIVAGGLALAAPAMAQTPNYVGVPMPAVGAVDAGGGVLSTAGTRDGAVLASQAQLTPQVAATQGNSSGLAFTGADIAGLVTLGGISIGVGVIVVRSGRRRSETDSTGPLAAG